MTPPATPIDALERQFAEQERYDTMAAEVHEVQALAQHAMGKWDEVATRFTQLSAEQCAGLANWARHVQQNGGAPGRCTRPATGGVVHPQKGVRGDG